MSRLLDKRREEPTRLPTALAAEPFVVETDALVKRYDSRRPRLPGHRKPNTAPALNAVSLQVPQGSIYVLAGPNGAGKSSLIRVLMNLERPTAGSACIMGLDTQIDGPQARAQIGYVPERVDLPYRWMRIGEFVDHHAAYHPGWDAAYAGDLLELFELSPDRKVGALSKGQCRRLQLTLAMAQRPGLLLLDEPTDGLDPVIRNEVLGLIAQQAADTGCGVLISTHQIYEMEGLADHVGVLKSGKLLFQGPCEDLRSRLRLYRADFAEGWAVTDIKGLVSKARGLGRELAWTIWGEEAEVVVRLAKAGATVRSVEPIGLDAAVIALLSAKGMS